jgi:hypothetical protein
MKKAKTVLGGQFSSYPNYNNFMTKEKVGEPTLASYASNRSIILGWATDDRDNFNDES